MRKQAVPPQDKTSSSSVESPPKISGFSKLAATTNSNANDNEEQAGGSSSSYANHSNDELKRSSFCSDEQLVSAITATENAFTQDPHEVLRASLEFQRMPLQTRDTSSLMSSSLYPSMEYVKRAASDFDFETDWQNAAISSRKEATSSHDNNILSADRSLEDAAPMLVGGIDGCVFNGNNDYRETLLNSGANAYTPTTLAASANVAEAEAQVMNFEYERIHPLEEESVVQAVAVHQGDNGHAQEQQTLTTLENHHEAIVGATCIDQGNLPSVCEPSSNDELATEATVIESGPAEKATIAAWSGHSTEAVVLQQEGDDIDNLDANSLDEKMTIGTSQTLSERNQDNGGVEAVAEVDSDADVVTTVVDYNVHPSEMTNHSVQAELIGNSSTGDFVSNGVGMIRPDMDETQRTTEATVLDSGPSDKATVDAWSTRPPEEAQVLPEIYDQNASVSIEDEDSKMSPCAIATPQDVAGGSDDHAEIVEISESYHPGDESASTAQFIGNGTHNAIYDSGHIYQEEATVDIIVEQNLNQAQAIGTIEAQSHFVDEVDGQGTAAPATILGVQNVYTTASIDNQLHGCEVPTSPVNCSNNFDGHVESDSIPFGSHISGEYSSCAPTVGESIEVPRIPQPEPFSSGATTSTTNSATSIGISRSIGSNRNDFQTVSTSFAIYQSITKN